MIKLSCMTAVTAAIGQGRNVALAAYTLAPGRMMQALTAAARRGAHVCVRLEAQPFDDPQGVLAGRNAATVARLQAAGIDAALVHAPGSAEAPLHLKALIVDAAVYFDDRNWVGGGGQTIVYDDNAADRVAVRDAMNGHTHASAGIALHKRDALVAEAKVLDAGRGDIAVESESFGAYNAVYRALDAAAIDGDAPRLLVGGRAIRGNAREIAALSSLAHDGVRVRMTSSDEKCAFSGDRAWTGSANATAAFDVPDQLDWGVASDDAAIVEQLRSRFDRRWNLATPFTFE